MRGGSHPSHPIPTRHTGSASQRKKLRKISCHTGSNDDSGAKGEHRKEKHIEWLLQVLCACDSDKGYESDFTADRARFLAFFMPFARRLRQTLFFSVCPRCAKRFCSEGKLLILFSYPVTGYIVHHWTDRKPSKAKKHRARASRRWSRCLVAAEPK